MKSMVIYDSAYGNIDQLALVIASVLATTGESEAIEVNEVSIRQMGEMDLIVLGCPTLRRRISPAMREFMKWLPRGYLHGIHVAVFDTRYDKPVFLSGSAARELLRFVRQAGGRSISSPTSFLIHEGQGPLMEGQLERATRWAESLITRIR